VLFALAMVCMVTFISVMHHHGILALLFFCPVLNNFVEISQLFFTVNSIEIRESDPTADYLLDSTAHEQSCRGIILNKLHVFYPMLAIALNLFVDHSTIIAFVPSLLPYSISTNFTSIS